MPTSPAATRRGRPAPALPYTQPAIVDPRIQERVKNYAVWLAKQARYDELNDNAQEINDYIQEATKVVEVGKQKVAMFAPFRPKLSALQTFTTRQVVALCIIGLLWLIGLVVFRLEMLTEVVAVVTVIYFFTLMLNVSMALRTFRNSPEERVSDEIVHALKDADWPLYTILCPLYREAQVVPQFVQAMLALDYPPEKLQVLFLTEADDTETRNAIRALTLPPNFKILVVPDGKPRTKPRACNYGLMHAQGPYIVLYDAEDIPDPLQLKKAVLTFANHGPEVACVQAKLNFYNPHQNLLTCLFTAEYSLWFDLILPGLQRVGFSIPLGGTSNHFQTRTLRALGGWDAFNVTEDCDLGLRLHRYNLQTVVLNSITYEEANSQFRDWLRQRSRWVKGYMQSYLVHMRNPLRYLYSGSLGEFLSLQFMVGGKTAVLFLNPLLWLLVAMNFILRPVVGDAYQTLFPQPLLYLGTLSLIFGNFFYYYLYLVACVRRKHYGLIRWTLLVPFYWMMMSVAAFIALFQLIVKPHYSEKTEHGLHLLGNQLLPDSAFTQSPVNDPAVLIPPAISANGHHPISSIKTSFWGAMKLPLSTFSRSEQEEPHWRKRFAPKDPWPIVMHVTACITSIAAWWYYFQHQGILLYGDAYGHLRIARAVFDGPSVSFAQLGGVWLPLQHVLMLPFIWNDYLWRTGLAGSIPAMACYIVSCIYLYLAARRLTRNCYASS